MKKNKNEKFNSLILKSFIIIAVVMMLLSIVPTQGEINEKSSSSEEKYTTGVV